MYQFAAQLQHTAGKHPEHLSTYRSSSPTTNEISPQLSTALKVPFLSATFFFQYPHQIIWKIICAASQPGKL